MIVIDGNKGCEVNVEVVDTRDSETEYVHPTPAEVTIYPEPEREWFPVMANGRFWGMGRFVDGKLEI